MDRTTVYDSHIDACWYGFSLKGRRACRCMMITVKTKVGSLASGWWSVPVDAGLWALPETKPFSIPWGLRVPLWFGCKYGSLRLINTVHCAFVCHLIDFMCHCHLVVNIACFACVCHLIAIMCHCFWVGIIGHCVLVCHISGFVCHFYVVIGMFHSVLVCHITVIVCRCGHIASQAKK